MYRFFGYAVVINENTHNQLFLQKEQAVNFTAQHGLVPENVVQLFTFKTPTYVEPKHENQLDLSLEP